MKRDNLQHWCLENNREDLLKEWDLVENSKIGIFPEKIGCKSYSVKVWWRCPQGHSYDAYVGNRTKRNDGCPFCSGHRLLVGFNDLQTVAPLICAEWDFELNKAKHDQDIIEGKKNIHPISPADIQWGSSTNVYWCCKNGHKSYSSPNKRHVRIDGSYSKCDRCSVQVRMDHRSANQAKRNNLAVLVPQSRKEWMYSEHHKTPYDVSYNSIEMVHWKCKNGHEFDRRVCDRVYLVNGQGYLHRCAECMKRIKTSFPEQAIFYYIQKEYPDAQNRFKELGFEIDIFIPSKMIGIEYDGSAFHKGSIERDRNKDLKAEWAGITLYRFRAESISSTNKERTIFINEDIEGLEKGINSFFSIIGIRPPDINILRDYNDIYELVGGTIGKSVADTNFLDEWDFEKNTIKPEFISSGETHISVWWKCPNGHPSYPSYPYNRIKRGTHCPICSQSIFLHSRMKKVRNIDTGEIFNSASEAERIMGHPHNTSISTCCRGKYKTAYGYHWEYVE